MDQQNSPTLWPRDLVADRDMIYESIDLLYRDSNTNTFGEHLGFIVSCSRYSLFKNNDVRGILHKLEVNAMLDFSSAKLSVTHEVLPGLGSSSQVIPINQGLKVACFDTGCVIPITNFGLNKTFNSNVRSRLSHHSGQINCLAVNPSSTLVASGCTAGEISLYQVCEDEISFLSRTTETQATYVTSMSFVEPQPEFNLKSKPGRSSQEESVLIYTTNSGRVCLLDTRCKLAESMRGQLMFQTEPRISLTSMVSIRSKPGHLAYFGGAHGEVFSCDLRKAGQYVYENQKDSAGGSIRRMKEVVVSDVSEDKSFLAYSNSTRNLQILDLDNLNANSGWHCDRMPEGRIHDLVQVRDKIVTCGEKCSIGCWKWDSQSDMDTSAND